jgi:hypothetical protein
MKALLGTAVLLLLAPAIAFAQAKTDKTPKPGPEIQKLAYYIGTWMGAGETKGGPFGAAGKLSSRMTCKWFTGGFHVVCQGEETGPTGTRAFLNILGYDADAKAYTQHSISSFGESEDDRGGSLVGDRLTYLLGGDAGGKSPRIRYTEVRVSPVLYTYQAEAAVGGKPWTMIAQGKITKVK